MLGAITGARGLAAVLIGTGCPGTSSGRVSELCVDSLYGSFFLNDSFTHPIMR